jgi:hypothetical protein
MFLPFFFCFILYRLKIYYSEALANAGAFFVFSSSIYINIKINKKTHKYIIYNKSTRKQIKKGK